MSSPRQARLMQQFRSTRNAPTSGPSRIGWKRCAYAAGHVDDLVSHGRPGIYWSIRAGLDWRNVGNERACQRARAAHGPPLRRRQPGDTTCCRGNQYCDGPVHRLADLVHWDFCCVRSRGNRERSPCARCSPQDVSFTQMFGWMLTTSRNLTQGAEILTTNASNKPPP